MASEGTLSKATLYTLWRVGAEEANEISGHNAGVVARLMPGKTEAQANAELNRIAERMDKEFEDALG